MCGFSFGGGVMVELGQAIKLIKYYESYRKFPYLCPTGYYTIGYGSRYVYDSTGKVDDEVDKDTFYFTQSQADIQLTRRLEFKTVPFLKKVITYPVNDNQFQAICSLVYNIGRKAFARSNALKCLNRGDLEQFQVEFAEFRLGYNKKTKKREVLGGLVKRRTAELELFNKKDSKMDLGTIISAVTAPMGAVPKLIGAGLGYLVGGGKKVGSVVAHNAKDKSTAYGAAINFGAEFTMQLQGKTFLGQLGKGFMDFFTTGKTPEQYLFVGVLIGCVISVLFPAFTMPYQPPKGK